MKLLGPIVLPALLMLVACVGGTRLPLDANQARMRIQDHLRAAYATRGIVTAPGFPQYHSGWDSRDGGYGGIWIADAEALRVAECMIDAQGTVTIKAESEFKWTRAETVAKARSFVQQDEESRTYLEKNGFDGVLDYITLENMQVGSYSRYWSVISPKFESTCASIAVFPSGKIEVVISMP